MSEIMNTGGVNFNATPKEVEQSSNSGQAQGSNWLFDDSSLGKNQALKTQEGIDAKKVREMQEETLGSANLRLANLKDRQGELITKITENMSRIHGIPQLSDKARAMFDTALSSLPGLQEISAAMSDADVGQMSTEVINKMIETMTEKAKKLEGQLKGIENEIDTKMYIFEAAASISTLVEKVKELGIADEIPLNEFLAVLITNFDASSPNTDMIASKKEELLSRSKLKSKVEDKEMYAKELKIKQEEAEAAFNTGEKYKIDGLISENTKKLAFYSEIIKVLAGI